MTDHVSPFASVARSRRVLVTGGTGYLGRALVPALVARGHRVRVLVRPGSAGKIAVGAEAIAGNPLVAGDIAAALADADTLVHLVGVPKPSPAKARQFRAIDLISIQAAVAAITGRAAEARSHLVYLSVAQPAPVIRAYLAVRAEGEALIRARGITATFLRPWYVIGPGHRWPLVLTPIYALLRFFPATRPGAERLGFVTLAQMIAALVCAVEERPEGVRVVEVPEMKAASA